MQLVLTIPAQPATQMKERQAALLACYRDGTLLLDARDYEKPARFYLTPKDVFPWEQFLAKMLCAWQLGDYSDVPPQFKPQKRIPQYVVDGFPAEPLENKLKILATLRTQGYFPALTAQK
jgi:hypothetical protein